METWETIHVTVDLREHGPVPRWFRGGCHWQIYWPVSHLSLNVRLVQGNEGQQKRTLMETSVVIHRLDTGTKIICLASQSLSF